MEPDRSKGERPGWAGCTIASAGELATARVLARSFCQFHPEATFTILLLDPPTEPSALSSLPLYHLPDLRLAKGEEWRLPMLYRADELRAILQPALFQTLLKNGNDLVAYFEVSTQILAPMSDILELAPRNESGIVSTTLIRDGHGDWGRSFLAATAEAQSALSTWSQLIKKRTDLTLSGSSNEDLHSLFDSVPHQVISAPGFAVSYATLDPSTLTLSDKGYEVAGKPLRSFDFRGYNPDQPHLLSKFLGLEPRILLSEYPVVTQLCDGYREELLQAGYKEGDSTNPSTFEVLPSGLRIDARMSRVYRQALDDFKSQGGPEPPSPFGPKGEEAFLAWLNESVSMTQTVVTRYMLAVHGDRDDVKKAFPNPTGADADGFRNWYLLFGQYELNLPAAMIPHKAASKSRAAAVNVAGYFRAELGLGTVARGVLAALEASKVPFNTIPFEGTANRQSHPFVDRQAPATDADINIVCVNPDQICAFAEKAGPELWQGRYTIGLWFWEVEDFPRSLHHAFNYVDEIWVASVFMQETFLKVSPKTVFKYQLPVLAPETNPSLSLSDFGLPNQFTFLFSFDFLSVLERKNPVGLIEAFCRSFRAGEGPALVIKTINGDKRIPKLEKLRYAARGRPDIFLKDGYLTAVEHSSLMAQADCYVSLHRSEGFGLTMAEAMALNKPTIGTGYSGNLEFMTEENSYLCPSRPAEVGPGREPYPATSHWSEPDLDAAAGLLRRVYLNQEEARAKGLKAAADITRWHSTKAAGAVIHDRLAKIRQRCGAGFPQPSIAYLQDRVESLEAENARLRSQS